MVNTGNEKKTGLWSRLKARLNRQGQQDTANMTMAAQTGSTTQAKTADPPTPPPVGDDAIE